MFYKYFVFRNKETKDIELIIEKDKLNTKISLIIENFNNWSWETVPEDEIEELK